MGLVRAWLVAFVMTVAVEVPIVAWLYRRREPALGRRLLLGVFASLLTHPAVWFIFPKLPLPYARQVALAELWAFALEGLYFHVVFPGDPRRAWLTTVVANGASLVFGYAWLAVVGHF